MTKESGAPVFHEVPKCNYCGNIAPWKIGPILRTMDFVIGVALLLLGFIPGLVNLGVVALIRSNEKIVKKFAQNVVQGICLRIYI